MLEEAGQWAIASGEKAQAGLTLQDPESSSPTVLGEDVSFLKANYRQLRAALEDPSPAPSTPDSI